MNAISIRAYNTWSKHENTDTYLVEKQSKLTLRLADPFTEAISSFTHEEGHLLVADAALVGQRPRHQRFPRSWKYNYPFQ